MRHILVVSISLIALAACSRPVGNSAAGAPAAGQAATPAAAQVAAGAVHMPIPRAGLWEITIGTDGSSMSVRSCADGQAPQSVGGGGSDPACQPQMTQAGVGVIAFTSSCAMPGGYQIASHGTITGDSQTSYGMHIDSTTSGAPMAQLNGPHVTEITGRYQGACPANMPPGSIEMNGHVITREEMAASRARTGAR